MAKLFAYIVGDSYNVTLVVVFAFLPPQFQQDGRALEMIFCQLMSAVSTLVGKDTRTLSAIQ